MAAKNGGKFDHLFYEITPPYTGFKGEAHIPGSTYSLTYQDVTAPLVLDGSIHRHSAEQYLIFLGGALPDVFSSWDAEATLQLGPSTTTLTTVTITKPSVVRIPRNWQHGNVTVTKVGKPLVYQAALLQGSYEALEGNAEFPAPLLTAEGERLTIADLVCELPIETTEWGPWCPTPQAYFRGTTYMKEAGLHVGFQVFNGDFPMEDGHMHQGEEYIFFLGGETGKDGLIDVFDFRGKIEFYIGADPDHMEVHWLDKPTIVRLPPNIWHSPINFTEVGGNIQFMATWLNGTWGTITRREQPDGTKYFNYMGDDMRMCVLEPTKRCTLCTKCFKLFKEGTFRPGDNLSALEIEKAKG
ncbi:MAG: hypothetical protein LBM98_06055 [Oscillospiraceae bacterium]|jgi:hypothetical protein|nr:hypothetical protein [Oscillospiraceae bacterium]